MFLLDGSDGDDGASLDETEIGKFSALANQALELTEPYSDGGIVMEAIVIFKKV